jgi:hypothetical protein
MNAQTTDLLFIYIVFGLLFVAAVVLVAVWRVCHAWFCEALDSVARDVR